MELTDEDRYRELLRRSKTLSGRSPDQRPLDTAGLLGWMGQSGDAAHDELARLMNELVDEGYIDGRR